MILRSTVYIKYIGILKSCWNVHHIKNIFEKLPLPQRQLLDVEWNMLFKNQDYDFFNKHDIYYGNKILWGKQIIPFEEAALL